MKLTACAAGIGLAAGGAAFVLVHSIGLLTNLALLHRWGWDLPSLRGFSIGPSTYAVAVGGALVVSLLAKWSPVIRGHGIPEAMEAVLTKQSRIAPRAAIAKPLSATIAIGTGGPFGAEGPIIVTGGAIGSLLGQAIHVTPNERKILLASGAAAGMAAVFGSPLAAVILAIELLLFEFSTRSFIPLVVATSVAAGVHSALFSSGPLLDVPAHHFSGLGQLPVFAVLGLLCGLLAVVICSGLFFIEGLYRRLPVSEFWHAPIGAVLFVTVALLEPRTLGVGYDVIDDALATRLALGTIALIGVVKLVVWWLALASGTSGGTLAPVLMISACFGATLGELLHRLIPGLSISTGSIALVAMAATFGAATRATFAAIVFVFELTHDYNAILPLMLATVLATLVATWLSHDSLLTEKLTRRGLIVPRDYHMDVLQSARLADVMTRSVVAL
ncbi:MAG: chloride channel protein, partial [Ilumatobacteraceae bacterium]